MILELFFKHGKRISRTYIINFTPVNDDSQRCLEQIKFENTVKEQAMNDPLYVGKTYLNRNIETPEVHKHVWKMKNKKSPGIDSLPYEVLKKRYSHKCSHSLTSDVFRLRENTISLDKGYNLTNTKIIHFRFQNPYEL